MDEEIESKGGSASLDSETGSSPSSTLDQKSSRTDDTPEIAQVENRNVFRLRLLVFSVLVATTVGVAIGIYKYVRSSEREDFEQKFEDDSDKVLEAIGATLASTLGSVDSFLVALVSYARDTNSTFPFVTMPDYGVRVAKLRSLSKAVLVSQYQYVTPEERAEWEAYSAANDGWVQAGIETQRLDETFEGKIVEDFWTRGDIHDSAGPYSAPGPYLPKWQQAPVIPIYAPYNWDAMTFPPLIHALPIVKDDREIAISEISNIPDPLDEASVAQTEGNNRFIKDYIGPDEDETEPFSDIYFPMLDYAADFVTIPKDVPGEELGRFVGVFAMTFYWRDLMKDILPADSDGILVVFENSCGQVFTYQVNGPETVYLGEGDRHESRFDDYLSRSAKLSELQAFEIKDRVYTGVDLSDKGCSYTIHVYPSEEAEKFSSAPLTFMLGAICIFAFTSTVFIFYDRMVERRQAKVMASAKQSNAIVSSLFPSNVRDRLFQKSEPEAKSTFEHNKMRLKTFLSDRKSETMPSEKSDSSQAPIADLFPHCTVLFSDISGFTAWSSVREPSQVFTLLETVYGAFDKIAIRRGVFKVETIGDAYVACTGLPEPRRDHAVVMAKFARDCLYRMMEIVRELEVSLGPGTADLRLRFGIHSGEVTAGVLRGQKSRFQLFGDTVNTASRMESTGVPNRIQASEATAKLLIEARRSSWVKPREDLVEAKGKGTMQTYWIEPKMMGATDTLISEDSDDAGGAVLDIRARRLVDWNTDVLLRLIKQIVAKRLVQTPSAREMQESALPHVQAAKHMVLEEVKEIIELPGFDAVAYSQARHPEEIELADAVSSQMRKYVISIAGIYNDRNQFHGFDHASHVGMSTAKLLSRIIKPEEVLAKDTANLSKEMIGFSLHEHTFGLTSDPLTQFACVFAALIHDVDHPGVPNSCLVREKTDLAIRYQDKSVAEQNSVDVAWELFMSNEYSDLRRVICPTPSEMQRLRQLVVNLVMATDIMDPALKKLRNDRWETAFSITDEALLDDAQKEEQRNRKATIVIEHLIQASDVAHTMQHWHIYQKWNERLFAEMHHAYATGRADKDPADFWYEGELAFLDHYVLPLAQKLKNCGVFGVSSDEYLNYAMKNREEWQRRGKDVVADMVSRLKPPSSSFGANRKSFG